MKYRLVKIEALSGNRASIYTIVDDDSDISLFENFILEHKNSFKDEITDIFKRLKSIGTKTGAREHFFKKWEGQPGDGVEALFDQPKKRLRLYCIRFGYTIVILGGGGEKNVRALQDDESLLTANYFLRRLSAEMTIRIKESEIRYINDGLDFSGNLEFEHHEDC